MLIPFGIAPNEVPDASEITQLVLTGFTVVFAALILLIFFVWLFGKIFSVTQKNNTPAAQAPAAGVKQIPQQTQAAPVAIDNSDEVIAVISAAVAAISADEGKSYRIASVTPVCTPTDSRNAWSAAGLLESTRPF